MATADNWAGALRCGRASESILESLSALANLPGDGVIILGLDEATGFTSATLVNIFAMETA